MKIVIYHKSLTGIGGVRTFVINFCKRMSKHYEITFMFQQAPNDLLYMLSEYVNIKRYREGEIKCDYFIYASVNSSSIESSIKAKKIIQIIHADFKEYNRIMRFKFIPGKRTTHYVCVGENVGKSFKEFTGINNTVIRNMIDDTKNVFFSKNNAYLYLITASRISKEKGFERIIKLAKMIKEPFVWKIYGKVDTSYAKRIVKDLPEGMEYCGYKEDVTGEIGEADYLVQLSDTEGMPYSLLEALQHGTPVICTDFPSAHEIIEHGKNGYILDFQLSNFYSILVDNKLPILQPNLYNDHHLERQWIKFLK